MSGYWLFRFTSYSYCQGTRDAYREDMRLIKFTLPCDREEAKDKLCNLLRLQGIEFSVDLIECITYLTTNS